MIELGLVVVLGILAQWVAWRIKLPSILLLLVAGFASGPIFGWISPDDLFGDTLFPIVSLSVALILFEGGLSLSFSELRGTGFAILRLVLLGGLVTWLATSAAAWYLLGLSPSISILLGAVLVVTGPTVVLPLLRVVRPKANLHTILKWEGIAIDPVGATLALLIFEVILEVGHRDPAMVAVEVIGKTLLAGGVTGLAGAGLLMLMMRRFWLPDHLQAPGSLALVVGVFVLSNLLQEESGLFSVTLMGVVLANQRWVAVRHIIDFKEHLRVLLISTLFILLSARLTLQDFSELGWPTILFVASVILLIRPLSVFLSTMGTALSLKERLFISSLAPRGIVAAAVASIFALRLAERGTQGIEMLVPVTFATIIGTVLVYGLAARSIARWLGFTEADPQGVLFVGAQDWTRQMAKLISDEGFRVCLVDTNYRNVTAARMAGLDAVYGSILTEDIQDELNLDGIGRLVAATSNNEANSLAALHFPDAFGKGEVFQMAPDSIQTEVGSRFAPRHLRGRFAFHKDLTYDTLTQRMADGHVIRRTKLTTEHTFKDLCAQGEDVVVLFTIDDVEGLTVMAPDLKIEPKPGVRVIYLSGVRPAAG